MPASSSVSHTDPHNSPEMGDYEKKFLLPGDRYHSVMQFGGSTYKITQHYGFRPYVVAGPKAPAQHSDVKLSSSISRTKRTILELALCNDWDYFITMTLDDEKRNRFDLEAWHKSFQEFLKYRRKRDNLSVSYLLVPEQHGDGAWHCHGLIRGVMPLDLVPFSNMHKAGYRSKDGKPLPRKLRNSEYLNWRDYMNSFGFCSLGPLQNKEAASFYVTKYITKDLARCVSTCGKHMYWASRGLNRPRKFGEFEDRSSYIDNLLINKYEFCATGFVLPGEGWCSDLAAEIIESVGGRVFDGSSVHPLFAEAEQPSDAELEADAFAQFEQLSYKL